MKTQVLVLGAFLCLGVAASAQTTPQPAQNQKSTQSANRIKRNTTTGEQSMVGCVDQQGSAYVLRDVKTDQLITLQSTGNADDNFARFVGHQVQVSGSASSGGLKVTQIGQVADMCPIGK